MIVNPNPVRTENPNRPVPRPLGGPTGTWVLGAALGATGLMAGLFWTYANSVMPGLRRSDDRTFVTAMQGINEAIQNPAFLPVFFGAFVLPAAAAVQQRRLGARDSLRWTVAATAISGLALAVSFGINIPLNNELDRAGDPALIADLTAVRHDFEGPWVAANLVRVALCTAAFGCMGRALMLHGRQRGRG